MLLVLAVLVLLVSVLAVVSSDLGPGALGLDGLIGLSDDVDKNPFA